MVVAHSVLSYECFPLSSFFLKSCMFFFAPVVRLVSVSLGCLDSLRRPLLRPRIIFGLKEPR